VTAEPKSTRFLPRSLSDGRKSINITALLDVRRRS
jgi:hypothetical protein